MLPILAGPGIEPGTQGLPGPQSDALPQRHGGNPLQWDIYVSRQCTEVQELQTPHQKAYKKLEK